MKKTFLGAMVMLLLVTLSACNYYAEDADITRIDLKNDLAVPAKVELCKGDPHCDVIEALWPARQITPLESARITVTKGVKTIFRVSTEIDGNHSVKCLRVQAGNKKQSAVEAQLSVAEAC